jgi:hypothetical protein
MSVTLNLGVLSEFGQQSTLRRLRVNSINNLHEEQCRRHDKRSATVSGLFSKRAQHACPAHGLICQKRVLPTIEVEVVLSPFGCKASAKQSITFPDYADKEEFPVEYDQYSGSGHYNLQWVVAWIFL